MKKLLLPGVLLLVAVGGIIAWILGAKEKTPPAVIPEYSQTASDFTGTWGERESPPLIHNGRPIADILSPENYEKVGIDPTKYTTLKEFLEDVPNFECTTIDLVNEDFVTQMDNEDGSSTFTPFRFQKNAHVFEDEQNKNLAILDIYQACKDGMIFGGANSVSGDKVLFESDNRHSQNQTLQNIFSLQSNIYDVMNGLQNVENLSAEGQELLAYLHDLSGDYETAHKTRCSQKECPDMYVTISISGLVQDGEKTPLSGVTVQVLNSPEISTTTGDDGKYTLTFSLFKFSHVRLKASLSGYSDGFSTFNMNQKDPRDMDITLGFYLHKAQDIIAITPENKRENSKGRYYVVETTDSTYMIPRDGLHFPDGTLYEGDDFEVYLYQFTKQSNMENLLENDTFAPVLGYVGNIMKTFGMPYIQIFDKESERELFTYSSNPMILQNQVYHMKELYDNYDQIYEAITDEDMQMLYNDSQASEGYPIDMDYLTNKGMLRWPARWALDRRTGIWSNIGHRLLDTKGKVEMEFWHIKDTK